MHPDVVDLRSFYAGPLGVVARRLLGRSIRARWGNVAGQIVLGVGYATPYLDVFTGEAERILAFMPAAQGVVNWPTDGLSASALAELSMLPLRDSSVDRVLVVHALETGESPGELLSEIWRILTPGGRLIAVAPNRRGMWARMDTTPFGQGQPFSRGQLTQVLREALFSPVHWSEALYVPPFPSRTFLRSATAWERLGVTLSLPFAGVHVIEATKTLYRPVVVRQTRRVSARMSPALAATPRVLTRGAD
ncbi:class I SAM-dependent methyltransferase [Alsobacter sp. SYSU M60028]|uniref:Class I SAM-dependent methyltransferase n=1 Tax=Alsobacter ponti TaxID=2962936 RepID=A0ABT1LBM7_9HYPH|nr:class I SAM-dependent methyltransferase [Alsobacter ponti]MCP8938890.1 class I SAM-dependent methyltransferase [Alsobacter ponti]